MSRSAKNPIHLTQRDLQIILMVYRYDGLVNQQLKRRFWPSFGARSRYFDRLARLINHGYLKSLRLPSAAKNGAGSGPSWITLASNSYPILERDFGVTDFKHLRH